MTTSSTIDPLFAGRVPEAAARQLATVLAWLTECQLATLEGLELRKRSPRSEISRQALICDQAVAQCYDLGLRPDSVYGLRGAKCGRLAERLEQLTAAAVSGIREPG